MHSDQKITVHIDDASSVSGLWRLPADARACFVFAHGAGAGMGHPFMQAVAEGLADRAIATLRYQFPYMERGSRRTDVPPIAHAAVRAAVAEAGARVAAPLPLYAGGKSFGARMSSQAQAAAPLPRVEGLLFLGFPLHPAGRPSSERAQHLAQVRVPMLFLQGTRDELAEWPRIEAVVAQLGTGASLVPIDQADHSFHFLKRSGRTNAQVLMQLQDAIAAFVGR